MPPMAGVPTDVFDRFMLDDLEIFGIEPEFREKLRWMDEFVREKVEPIDLLHFSPYDTKHPIRKALFPPLQEEVRKQGLWACHLGPELGGPGYGQLKLALMNMILGRSKCASKIFGTAAPDTGNAESIAHFGSPAQKKKYLEPLLADEVSSCWAMTEPQAGADPKHFRLTAVREGDDWVLNGEKIWSSNAKFAAFYLVCAVTAASHENPYKAQSIFIVEASNPGVKILRNLGVGIEEVHEGGSHGHVQFSDCRVSSAALLGQVGDGFLVQQTRLSGGRIHYGMRAVGQCFKALNMMLVRVRSRETQGESLAKKQLVQQMLAEAWMELEQLKLLVLRTAWKIDKYNDYKKVRLDISACKILCSRVQHDVCRKAIQLHGGLGASWDLPLGDMLLAGLVLGIADGPSEVHLQVVAKELMRGYHGTEGPFPHYIQDVLKKQAAESLTPALREHGIDLMVIEDEAGVTLKAKL